MIDILPGLMSSVQMIHTIARYYNTQERMTSLLSKMTDQMIKTCKGWIMAGGSIDALWDREPQVSKIKVAAVVMRPADQQKFSSFFGS